MGNRAMLTVCLLAALFTSSPCYAHKMNVFAVVEGATIRGEAYFRGQTPVQAATVRIFAPDAAVLFEGKTDADGKFNYSARQRVDHKLVVDLGDGHSESYVVRADELPAHLPGGSVNAATVSPPAVAPELPAQGEQRSGLETQVAQLRRELQAFQRETRWHDVLGGIGYILGLMGLAFYFLGTRRGAKREC